VKDDDDGKGVTDDDGVGNCTNDMDSWGETGIPFMLFKDPEYGLVSGFGSQEIDVLSWVAASQTEISGVFEVGKTLDIEDDPGRKLMDEEGRITCCAFVEVAGNPVI
jgi:hypothetical protein